MVNKAEHPAQILLIHGAKCVDNGKAKGFQLVDVSFNAHVNNVSYLLKKNSVTSKGIRYVLNSLPEETRKRIHRLYRFKLLI